VPYSSSTVRHLAQGRKVFDIELAALKAVRAQLDGGFNEAVEIICQTLRQRGKVIVMGIGKSGNIGHKISATLTSTGSTSVVLNSVDALHGDLGIVNDGDLVLALSYSGESAELLNLLPALKRFSVRMIAMTGSPRSSLARFSDVVLKVRVPKEACPFNLAPTASTTAMLVMGDALAMAVLQARGFKQQDFAKFHPSGAIGRTLEERGFKQKEFTGFEPSGAVGRAMLSRVADIMRTGPLNAVAGQDILVKEALALMNQAQSGSLSVVNERGKLVGVFTDGDFRRQITRDAGLLERPLKRVMTRQPIRIHEQALAVEAVRIFNERSIDDLIVVNSREEPIGLVDSQDLPKLKVM
jgi:arabinose-5-phosphate isomerase